MANQSLRQRRILLIDPVVQGAIVRQSFMHWVFGLSVATLCLLILQVAWEGIDKDLSYHLTTLWTRYGVVMIVMACLFPIFAYDSVRLSHRFTGPIYALRVALHKLADGQKIPEVAFRKGDYWGELARDVNQIASRLEKQSLTGESTGENGSQSTPQSAETSPVS